eukprot:scaffold2695_cov239-Pinguiococcus_pyrenoidosus.AAC.4
MASDIRIRVKRPRGCAGAPPSFLVEGGPAKRRRSAETASVAHSFADLDLERSAVATPRRPLPRHRFIFRRVGESGGDEEQKSESAARVRHRLRRVVKRQSGGVTLDFEIEEPK